MSRHPLSRIVRIDASSATIENEHNVPITLFANEEVRVEAEGIEQLLGVASLQDTLREVTDLERAGKISPFWGESSGEIASIVLTPDFHRGGGIPVGTVIDTRGFVVPAAVGNDVCCGMRLLTTDLSAEAIFANLPEVKRRLRSIFFQGARDIPMSPRQREALLRDGLHGLYETRADNDGTGLWKFYDPGSQQSDLKRSHFDGALHAEDIFGFKAFIEASGESDGRDGQIGSLGGSNHFCEVQVVEEILDGAAAHAWGVTKGSVMIMVHTGSVGLGHMVGGHFGDIAKSLYPTGIKHPKHGFYVLPIGGPHGKHAWAYLDAMNNAANFAFGNRLFLSLMATRALTEATRKSVSTQLVYDAPHNLIWDEGSRFIHRKGATPAFGQTCQGPFGFTGLPTIVPGSMGAYSYLMAGQGNEQALCSACHGAGRALSRGKALHVDEKVYEDAMSKLHVVNPIDPDAPNVKYRKDILKKYHDRLKEEQPSSYKDITPIIASIEGAGIAKQVARLRPLLTVKG